MKYLAVLLGSVAFLAPIPRHVPTETVKATCHGVKIAAGGYDSTVTLRAFVNGQWAKVNLDGTAALYVEAPAHGLVVGEIDVNDRVVDRRQVTCP